MVIVKYVNNKVVVLGLIPCSLVDRYQFAHRIYLQVHGRITIYKSTGLYGFTSQKNILLTNCTDQNPNSEPKNCSDSQETDMCGPPKFIPLLSIARHLPLS